ncbi:MAG: UDP-N-acetylmuramoyl-L-alanine--D-glutamate ligase [Acidobacteria bacterium]|nr:UDP-N-acetylmuramoyl-L-alanine--D-glutamate ligase [Acidobacteriota bacterium]
MFRPTGFADLLGRRVGIYGYGVEGRATARRLHGVGADLVIVDDDPRDDGVLATGRGGLEALATCDVVVKSPGIPRRRGDVVALEERGVTVTSALDLWLHEIDRERVIAVTGTKGKSTTTSLVAFFLRVLGEEAQELGNFGQPPYDPEVDASSGWLVLEVSSFQSLDVTRAPSLVLVTSLGSDHLDWHGTLEQYHEDKLTITRAAGEHVTLIAERPELLDASVHMGGHVVVAPLEPTGLAHDLGLLGAHNEYNVGLALRACALATGRRDDDVRTMIRARAREFTPLRGRLTLIGSRDADGRRVRYVDDGLATSPLPTLAALDVFVDDHVALIAGGFDRGVDYDDLARELGRRHAPTTVVVMGPAGERLAASLRGSLAVIHCPDMRSAVDAADRAVDDGGVVLFSPAAPSFDAYRNWAERSDDFARCVRSLLDAHPGTRARS